MRAGRRIAIEGIVQGVGFRPWIHRLAREQGLSGRVRNDARGVTIDAFGSEAALDAFLRQIQSDTPPAASVRKLDAMAIPDEPIVVGFQIADTSAGERPQASIPADLGICDACAAEIVDPSNRRYRYAFTNCTNCGPRFTIVRESPYDRDATTMAPFTMCPACRAEYDDPADRRFHAQPNACQHCGPRLAPLRADDVAVFAPDPLAAASQAICAGRIVAVKGLGGFHLACDATNPAAVRELRRRKRREEKPFAVLVRDLAEAERLAVLSVAERELLASAERPIVLVDRRDSRTLAPEIAPDTPRVGLMLPYTPLHVLLSLDAGVPLVMTSGNVSDEPLAYRNEQALTQLRGIADLFLLHDRAIETRCDDSVAQVVSGAPMVLRRSRGYVPRPIAVTPPFEAPVLACGALLKNTFCIGVGDSAYLGPHIGDLENVETAAAFEESLDRMLRFLRVKPRIVAHDLHPDYVSTRYALAQTGMTAIGVQHHHAHVASAMAEHGLDGPVLGVAFDGTGFGTDGTAWGGELMLASYARFERLATLRPLPLAGGDMAIREPWRIALALLADACGDAATPDDFALFRRVPTASLTVVKQMLALQVNSPLARGVGRYFDAVGALVLARPESAYEGQMAAAWNAVADPHEYGVYTFAIDRATLPCMLDLRPAVRDIVDDLRDGVSAARISARFHNTLAAATVSLVSAAQLAHGPLPVVLTGGCFQNARLAEAIARPLSHVCTVHLHRRVPPGDGGIALGQAMVARAIAGERE